MSRVKKINYSINYKFPISLREEIGNLKNPTKEFVQDLYGSFGLDVYEDKNNLTILSRKEQKKTKSMLYKIKEWFTGDSLYDFEEGDTLKDIVFKYAVNKKAGLVNDVKVMFGKRGMESFETLRLLGYVVV